MLGTYKTTLLYVSLTILASIVALFLTATPTHAAVNAVVNGGSGTNAQRQTVELTNTIRALINSLERKEYELDPIAHMNGVETALNYARQVQERLQKGGRNGEPQFIQNLERYRAEIRKAAAENTIEEIANSNVCGAFKEELIVTLKQQYVATNRTSVANQNTCPLDEVTGNQTESFIKGNFTEGGGIRSLYAIAKNPENSPMGSYLANRKRLNEQVAEAEENALIRANWGSGFRDQYAPGLDVIECTKTEGPDGVRDDCDVVYPAVLILEQGIKAQGVVVDLMTTLDEHNTQQIATRLNNVLQGGPYNFSEWNNPSLNAVQIDELLVRVHHSNTGGTSTSNLGLPQTNTGGWVDGENAYDGTANTFASDNSGDSHRFGTFGLTIPSNSAIEGIEVVLETTGPTAGGTIRVDLSWNNGISWTTATTTPTLTSVKRTITLGSPTQTWGRAWQSSEFSNNNFLVRVVGQSNTPTNSVFQPQGPADLTFAPNDPYPNVPNDAQAPATVAFLAQVSNTVRNDSSTTSNPIYPVLEMTLTKLAYELRTIELIDNAETQRNTTAAQYAQYSCYNLPIPITFENRRTLESNFSRYTVDAVKRLYALYLEYAQARANNQPTQEILVEFTLLQQNNFAIPDQLEINDIEDKFENLTAVDIAQFNSQNAAQVSACERQIRLQQCEDNNWTCDSNGNRITSTNTNTDRGR